MKKKMRLTYQNILATLLLSLLAFSSCRDEDLMDSIYLGDGRTVNVTIPISVSGRSVHTRTWIPEEDENKVQDFYLLAYRAGESSTNKLAAKRYFAQGEGMLEGGKLNMTLPTGTYKLVGVANLKPGVIEQNVFEEIENLPLESDYSKLKNITVGLAVKGNLDRNTPALPMVGINNNVEIRKDNQQVDPIHLKHLDTAVKFVFKTQLDETVTIKEGSEQITHTQTLQSFKLKSWQVFRIPNQTALISEGGNEDICTDFSDDPTPRINFDVKDKEKEEGTGEAKEESPKQESTGSNEFSFYMLENKKTPKTKIDDNTQYSLRDKKKDKPADSGSGENQDTEADAQAGGTAEGSGTPVEWEYANDNSTYVKVEASIDILLTKKNDNASHLRHADVTYYIHLGCTKSKGSDQPPSVDDYNTLHNGRYTYTVTVKGVNKIVVEATREDAEYQNGVEGTVVDFGSEGKRIELDAHYSVFNLEMTPEEISKMGVEIKSPLTDYTYVPTENPQQEDADIVANYDWQSIRFAIQKERAKDGEPTPLVDYSKTYDVVSFNESNLQEGMDPLILEGSEKYKDGTHTIPLYDFRTLKKYINETYYNADGQPKGNTNTNEKLTLTVFVNEYVYYEEDLSKYINAADRSWRVISERDVSADGNSTYIQAKYTVVQHAIQTYYPDNSQQIIGWEHTNEHFGKKICLPPQIGTKNLSHVNGLWNVCFNILERNADNYKKYFSDWSTDKKWTTWATPTEALSTKEGYYAFKTKTAKEAANENSKGEKYDYDKESAYCIDKNYGGRFWDRDEAVYDAVAACLSRNRDLDRDGEIEENEIRWFLPTDRQHVDAVIGAGSLVTPLVLLEEVSNKSNFPNINGFPEEDLQYPYVLLPYHFVGSNNRKLWGEQFIATGTAFVGWEDDLLGSSYSPHRYQNVGWNFRCARYIDTKITDYAKGLNPGKGTDKDSKPFATPYTCDEGSRIITADYESNSLRNPERGYLVVHGSFQGFNRTSRQFRYSKGTDHLSQTDLQPNGPNAKNKNARDLWRNLSTNGWAKEYHEEGDDRGTWRLPNLRELALLNMLGVLDPTKYYLSGSTYWDLTTNTAPLDPVSENGNYENLDVYYQTTLGDGNIARTTLGALVSTGNAQHGYELIFVRDEF